MSGYDREASIRYRYARRDKCKSYLGNTCTNCGSVDNLEFDHIDPKTKVSDIASAIAKHWSWDRLLVELQKCQLLCRSCHIQKSKFDGSSNGGGHNKIENPPHGTNARYQSHKCRCSFCKEWKRLYRKGLIDSSGNSRG